MGGRVSVLVGLALALQACGGSEFSDESGSGGGSGGSSASGGTGGSSASGGTGGSSASGGTGGSSASGGGGTGGAAGSGGSSGTAGMDGGAGDASTDAGPLPLSVVQASDVKLAPIPASSSTLSLPASPSPGNSIIVGVTCISEWGYDGDAGVAGDCVLSNSTITDTQSNNYTLVVKGEPISSSHQRARSYLFIAQNIASGGSFTITVDPEGTSTVQAIAWGAIEVAGLAAPAVDTTGISLVGDTSATNTTAATNTATSQPNELAVAVLSMRSESTFMGITPDATWVSHHIHQNSTSANGNPPGHSMVSKVLSTVGTVSHTWSHNPPTRGVAAVIATFKGAAIN